MAYNERQVKADYEEKVLGNMADLVKLASFSSHRNIKIIHEEFWKSYLEKETSKTFPELILDILFHDKTVKTTFFKEIDKNFEILNKLEENIAEKETTDEKDRAIIKYLIKTQITTYRHFWKEVYLKIENEACNLSKIAEEKGLKFNYEKLSSKLLIFEEGLLNALVDLYLNDKKSSEE